MTKVSYPQAYVEYLIYFHAERDYFECHEVLEEHWKEQGQKDQVWVGLIQLAVGFYHQRRDNFTGAARVLEKARKNLALKKERLVELGLEAEHTLRIVERKIDEAKNGQAYVSVNLPLRDPHLLQQCRQLCQERNLTWGKPSDLQDNFLVNKHRLRHH